MNKVMHGATRVLRDVLLFDGVGEPPVPADVAIAGEYITAIGAPGSLVGEHIIEAQGLALAPGFIDVHTHDDRALLMPGMMSAKLSQGVTTVITGNCGLSLAPAQMAHVPAPLDLIATPEWLRFPRFADYLAALTNDGIAVNAACMVGHTTLRASVMGDSLTRSASEDECARMRERLEESLAAGAFGFSTGTFYPPARAATIDEIVAVAEPLARYGALYATHMRNEAEAVLESLEETYEIGRRLGVRVLISHHKLAGVKNHGRSRETLASIQAARARQPVSLDCYPYNASSTTLNPAFIARAAKVLVSWSTPHPQHAGRLLADIAADWGVSDEAAAQRLMPAGAIYFMMDEDDVQRILAFPPTMIGSDGMPHDEHPHPRLWSTFPRVLGHYSRELGLFPLHTAVNKMSGLPAAELGIARRGRIAVGYYADLVLFNPRTVQDSATFAQPCLRAEGIEKVWVNGQLAWAEGKIRHQTAGQVIRR
ncbi:N-acyl-D-amino-acid deacylase family protein [Klebsiella pneumoniae]|uniref:N-acyl-D-amino-acid deacylase family protein n=1 Tax=Klebsiella pneumoniae TaxID=573 RepID=UPI0028B282F0|nr:D-aminoacylase [Klebsiella pneumoniae]HDY8727852.1 D-aminoacylase [Klebsiella pneumoniae]